MTTAGIASMVSSDGKQTPVDADVAGYCPLSKGTISAMASLNCRTLHPCHLD